MSDARLQGTISYSEDTDQYRTPAGLSVAKGTLRIGNDEGAWQGSSSYAYLPDGTVTTTMLVLSGEGA